MAYDGIVLRAVTDELRHQLLGGRIEKVYQPLARDLLIHIRNNGTNHRLLLSAHPANPRVLLTEQYKGQNPMEPPMFCMLLRKHYEAGRITAIEQVGNERILYIDVEHRDELGDLTVKRLIIEIMGRHSNIILVDPAQNRILDSVVHVNVGTSRHREVLPGRLYIDPPEQDKISPFDENRDGFVSKLTESELPLEKFLVHAYTGISPLLGREVAHRAKTAIEADPDGTNQTGASESPEAEWQAFSSFLQPLIIHQYSPTLVTENERPKAFSAVALTHLSGQATAITSISTCIETFFEEKAWQDALKQKAGDLERILQSEREKNAGKLIKFTEAIRDAADADAYRVYGELLMANLYQLERGMNEARVANFYDENMQEITIPMDVALSPQENAQAYFKKYNKVKKSVPILTEQIELIEVEITYIDSVLQLLSTADLKDLDEIREELVQEGYLKAKVKRQKQGGRPKKTAPTKPERYRSSDGIEIYVGKNNKQNDSLTMKMADSRETWLHTKDIPGSHVVIRAKEVPDRTLEEAAVLAAYFSKARESTQVPVDYTFVRHVWKPNGAKPGFVLYDNQKTVYVTPDREFVEKLRLT